MDDSLTINDNEYNWEYLQWIEQENECPDDECKNRSCHWCQREQEIQEKIKLLALYEKHPPTREEPGLTLKYFDNNGQGKQLTKAWKTDAGLDLYYTGSQPLVCQQRKPLK